MARGRAKVWGVALLAAVLLAACDDPAPRQAQAPAALAQGPVAEAVRGAEERLRTRLRIEGPMMQRAVQVHRQALAGTLAVCGQINPSGRGDDAWLPWVAVVGFEGQAIARMDFYLAASTPDATRVYFEMVDRCFDGGGPTSPRQGIRPLPPAPSGLPRSAEDTMPRAALPPPAPQAEMALPFAAPAPAPAPAPAASVAAAGPMQGGVTTSTRTPVNVRAMPVAGAEVMRVIPRGSALQVFGEAPGGWLQVGEGGEAFGWLHNSMLDR
jgi:hypothetical protein